MSAEEDVIQLAEACQTLIDMVNQCNDTIDELKQENTFLTDTIIQSKLCQITVERRELKDRMKKIKEDSDCVLEEANAIRSGYETKLGRVSAILKDVKTKSDDLDAYIEAETERKIEDIREDYEHKKRQNDKQLAKYKSDCDKQLQEEKDRYKKIHKIYILIMLVSILIGMASVIFCFSSFLS